MVIVINHLTPKPPNGAQAERRMEMANTLPTLVIRPDGPENIRQHCGVKHNQDLAEHIGLHRAQIGRVLSGKHAPGNRFIAGVIHRCGLEFAFSKVFELVPDEDA